MRPDLKIKTSGLVALILMVGIYSICVAAPLPKYAIVDLGTLGGKTSMAYGINDQGAVVGKSRTADGTMMAFYWDSTSGFIEIGFGEALGINNAGQVVGNIHHHTDDAFLWDHMQGLRFLNKGDFLFATANGISDSGKPVGYARKFNDVDGTMAILWDPFSDALNEITDPTGPGYAYGINRNGEVVGNWGAPSRAFLWSASDGMVDLGTLNQEPWQYYARDINDTGEVAGYLKTDDNMVKAFIWKNDTGIQLLSGDGESLALAINGHGQVVGAKTRLIGLDGTAYLWKNGQRIDLNETIPPDSGWHLREATGISNNGQICGNGLIHGEIHAFLLTPVSWAMPDIKANGYDSAITVSKTDLVAITLALDPLFSEGLNADWWIAAQTPFSPPGDWYSYVYPDGWSPGIRQCIQEPLFILNPYEVFRATLPVGTYWFYFALDDPDGKATGPWWGIDAVKVRVE